MFFRAFFGAFFSYLSGRFHNDRKKLVQLLLPHFQRLIRDVFLRFFWGEDSLGSSNSKAIHLQEFAKKGRWPAT